MKTYYYNLSHAVVFSMARLNLKAWFAALLIGASFGTATNVLASPSLIQGKIEVGEIAGNVTIKNAGGESKLVQGGVIQDGALVSTGKGSTATLFFANGAKVVVLPASDLKITKFDISQGSGPQSGFDKLSGEPGYSTTQLHLERGKVAVEVLKLKVPVSGFRVTTPSVIVDVRGTGFTVEQQPLFVRVATVSGVVEVRLVNNLRGVISLPEGKEIVFSLDANGAIPEDEQGKLSNLEPAVRDAIIRLLSGVQEPRSESVGFEQTFKQELHEDDVDNTIIGLGTPIVSPNGEGAAL